MKKVNAVGKNCPQPVIMTKEAVDEGNANIEVLVDNPVAGQNVSRFLSKKGFTVELSDENGTITVRGRRSAESATAAERETTKVDLSEKSRPAHSGSLAILISKYILGGDDKELGEVLIKSFLGTLAQMDESQRPQSMALMNEGVKLALKNTSTCETLLDLEKKGCKILVCGTCTNHFGITDKTGVGEISNMFDITESLLNADKTITV